MNIPRKHHGRLESWARCARVACIVLIGSATIGAATVGAPSARGAVEATSHEVGRPAHAFEWPTVAPHRIIRGFEAPATRYSAGHRGVDIDAASGTSVFAPAEGDVYFVGRVVDRSVVTLAAGDGLLVSIEPVDASVPLHARVPAGAQIGVVGRGGHCDGSCVHLGVRLDGEYVSPLLYLGGIERAVLLPMSPSD